jgi:5'-3' exoribonuclease 2
MKSKLSILALLLSLISCAAGPNAQTGAVLGALGGAAVGGIIGHQSGRGLEGAAIGAGAGAVGGGVIGNAQDQRNMEMRRQQHSQYYYGPGQPQPYYYSQPYYNSRSNFGAQPYQGY